MPPVRPRALVSLLFLAVIALVGSSVTAAPAVADDPLPTGSIEGRVTTVGGVALPDSRVVLTRPGSAQRMTLTTDADGRFSAQVAPAAYAISYTSVAFDGAFRGDEGGGFTVRLGPRVDVVAGSTSTADAVLQPTAAAIGGSVPWVDGVTRRASVTLLRLDDGVPTKVQTVLGDRNRFRFDAVPAGTYVVRFGDYLSLEETVFWPEALWVDDATPIVVGERDVRLDIDRTLGFSGSINGTIRDSKRGLWGIEATAYAQRPDGTWRAVHSARTNEYWAFALPPGTYRFGLTDPRDEHVPFFVGGGTVVDEAADFVLVASREIVRDLTMELRPTFVNGVAPAIVGKPTLGVPVTATSGTWVPTTGTLSYQWFAEDVKIDGATQATYTPVLADVKKRLRVHVTSSAPDHFAVTAQSEMTKGVGSSAPPSLAVTRRTLSTLDFAWGVSPEAYSYLVDVTVNGVKRASVDTRSLTTYAMTGLQPSSVVRFEVRSLASHSENSPPAVVSTTTLPMAKPTSFRSTARSKTSVAVAWTRPAGAAKYRVVYWTGSKAKKTKNLPNVGATSITGLKKKTTYSFYVQAISADNRSVTTSPTIKVKTK